MEGSFPTDSRRTAFHQRQDHRLNECRRAPGRDTCLRLLAACVGRVHPDVLMVAKCDDGRVTRSVLVVDDHPGFRAVARALLEAEGFDVIGEAADGESAITSTSNPNVVRR